MPVRPEPIVEECPKCGYSRVVHLKSDAINPMEFTLQCPKCGAELELRNLSTFEKILDSFKLS
ncbi:hypothetical protein MLC52_07055 [Sulfurimonas sp. NW15]|uniref:hypothetical protein n=1 Tax=Sulfurimonas sp. NW15 TaxID=2922729 RepID=UPI003DA83B27